ncbi:MAG: MBL fold metallo-hydrolase [Bacteroidota bacterium]|nr:MBL fold metallo-hydrolase [Bacteroidota bacterium]
MMVFISAGVAFTIIIALFMQQSQFGKKPNYWRSSRVLQSPNFRDSQFQNLNFTPVFAEDASKMDMIRDGIFKISKRKKPVSSLPSKMTNLLTLDPDENILVWFGHSSYFMQIDGKTILVDPVFSGSASPFSFMVKSFAGSDVYKADEMPEIDYLFITHDHWDHLDYKTVLKLKLKVGKIVTGLGTGSHLEHWGLDLQKIIELDWTESALLDSGFKVTATSGRHFTGRTFRRNQTLWVSFVLQTPTKKIFIGGDSGYDTHFAQIGNDYGPFDLALLECGQYNHSWKYIHMLPEETVQAAIDLKAKMFMPVHWAKFALSLHAWDESIERVTVEARRLNIPIVHPMIGESVKLGEFAPSYEWWKGIN